MNVITIYTRTSHDLVSWKLNRDRHMNYSGRILFMSEPCVVCPCSSPYHCRWICQILNSEKFINNINGKLESLILAVSVAPLTVTCTTIAFFAFVVSIRHQLLTKMEVFCFVMRLLSKESLHTHTDKWQRTTNDETKSFTTKSQIVSSQSSWNFPIL